MNRKKIIIILIFISILLVISGIAVYYLRPVPEFIDIEFYDFQPSEGYMVFKRDGYVYYSTLEDNWRVKYKYVKETNTIFFNGEKMKVIAYNSKCPMLLVDIDRRGDSAGGLDDDDKSFKTVIDSSNCTKKITYFITPIDGSIEGVYRNRYTTITFNSDNTLTSDHFLSGLVSDKNYTYYLGCFEDTDFCDMVVITNSHGQSEAFFLDGKFLRAVNSGHYSSKCYLKDDGTDDYLKLD